MSRGGSPPSPPADEIPILDWSPPTRASSGVQSSLLRFVARDSPASVRRVLERTSRSWDAVRTALGLRDEPPPRRSFASARSSPRCSTASCDASREEDDAKSAHGHTGWFREGFNGELANLLSARLDSVESDVAEASRRLASLERWQQRVDASAELASASVDSDDAAFASSSARTRSASSASSSPWFSEALASEASASRLSLVALVAAQTAARRVDDALCSSPSDPTLCAHRARGARLLHPSPPESPEEEASAAENLERRVVRASARSVSSEPPSIDGSDDGTDDGGLSRLIERVREVRAEGARLKNVLFFRESENSYTRSR